MSTAIEFNNISKLYRLGLVSTGTMVHDLKRWWTMNIRGQEDPYLTIGETNDRSSKGESDYVWALKDVDFKVEQGDVVGVIGKNGAGKSTLLKILSKITAPTTGTIKAKGRIGSLLEVGTGFHPEMTGRENIYLNGAILGMTKQEITQKLDEIVDFSGCERYIDTPVKRYSSGMLVRLGFAVAAHLDPEILVVDEVLAVGDAEFQKKAIGKMQDVSKGEGRTVLFVSHNMNAVKNLCHRGLLINNGKIVYDGNIFDAVDTYLLKADSGLGRIVDMISTKMPYLEITDISFNGTNLNKSVIKHNQETLELSISGVTTLPLFADVSFNVFDKENTPMASFGIGHFTGDLKSISPGPFEIKKVIKLPKYLYKGNYNVNLAMHQPGVVLYLSVDNVIELQVEGSTGEHGDALFSKYNGFFGFESLN